MQANILIAEDEPYIVESIAFLLGRQGHVVRSASTGSEAIRAMTGERPDLLILDIMLPETNGFDVLRQMRTHERLAGVPVMVLTAKGQEADRRRMMDLGANDFVTKPFSNNDLLARIDRLLEDGAREPDGTGRDAATAAAGSAEQG